MAYSRVSYTGTGSTLNVSLTFPYLDKTDIKVFVNAVSVPFTFLNTSTVTPTVAPAAGAIVQVRRITQKDSVPVNFIDGSVLLERDLDLMAMYSLYLAQENQDSVDSAISLNALGQMDAQGRRIVNVLPGVDPTDAVNKAQFDTYSATTSAFSSALAVSPSAVALATNLAAAGGVLLVGNATDKRDLVASSGAGLIGYAPTVGPSTNLQTRLRSLDLKTVNVQNFVTGGLGTSASPWTGWDTAIVWAASTQYDFLDGYYSYASSPNFGKTQLCLNGRTGTVIRHTGTGSAMVIDAGPLSSDFAMQVDIRCRLESNASATAGVYCRGVSRSRFDMSFRNIPGICFREIFGVCNTLRLLQTAFIVGQSVQPANMLSIEKRNAGEDTSASTYYLTAENCSATGVVLNNCLNGIFFGGTSEANGSGYFVSAASNYNTFYNLDLEVNSTTDLNCLGSYNTFINLLSTTNITVAGKCNKLIGGTVNSVASNGTNNEFDGLRYSANGGAFTNPGVGTIKRSVYSLTSSVLDVDVYPAIESLRTGSGSVSVPNASATTLFSAASVGMYQVFACVPNVGAANYSASAVVVHDGTTARITANNGALISLTLAGTTIQVSQSSGATQSVSFSYARIA